MRFSAATFAVVLAQVASSPDDKATSPFGLKNHRRSLAKKQRLILAHHHHLDGPNKDPSPPASSAKQEAIPKPLWEADSSAAADEEQQQQQQAGTSPKGQECDPDVGILACGGSLNSFCHPFERVCVEKVATSRTGRRFLQDDANFTYSTQCYEEPQPGYTCDCSQFDNEAGVGVFTCTNPNYCLAGVCGSSATTYNITSAGYDISVTTTVGDNTVFYSYDTTQADSTCAAKVNEVECSCTVDDTNTCPVVNATEPAIFVVLIDCPGVPAFDLCSGETLPELFLGSGQPLPGSGSAACRSHPPLGILQPPWMMTPSRFVTTAMLTVTAGLFISFLAG